MTLTDLLTLALDRGASDLHLSAGLPPILRIDGDIHHLTLPPIAHQQVHQLIDAMMNDRQRKQYKNALEIDFAFDAPNLARFRVNAFHHSRGMGAVLRIIPTKAPTMDLLGMGKIFRDIATAPRGLVLVTGPAGAGKSSTLAAMVEYINNHQYRHIITIEDPIEFNHHTNKCLISQREVHRDTPSFNSALRSALREDPDIIMVGELRDLETIRLAITAAETGHLVLGTLHTLSATKTIDRIIDAFPAGEKAIIRTMLSESLHAVISQTLLKKVGGGQVAAHEIMLNNVAISHLIRQNKVAQMISVIQTNSAAGMQTMEQCLTQLIEARTITVDTAKKQVPNTKLTI